MPVPNVGLKYKGKKPSLHFRNPNLICKEMIFPGSGETIQVPLDDARWMLKYSPHDFEIVYSGLEPLPPEAPALPPIDKSDTEVKMDDAGATVQRKKPGPKPKVLDTILDE